MSIDVAPDVLEFKFQTSVNAPDFITLKRISPSSLPFDTSLASAVILANSVSSALSLSSLNDMYISSLSALVELSPTNSSTEFDALLVAFSTLNGVVVAPVSDLTHMCSICTWSSCFKYLTVEPDSIFTSTFLPVKPEVNDHEPSEPDSTVEPIAVVVPASSAVTVAPSTAVPALLNMYPFNLLISPFLI